MTVQKKTVRKLLTFSLISAFLLPQFLAGWPVLATNEQASLSGQIATESAQIENLDSLLSSLEFEEATASAELPAPIDLPATISASILGASNSAQPSSLSCPMPVKKEKIKKPSLAKDIFQANEKINISLGDYQPEELEILIFDKNDKQVNFEENLTTGQVEIQPSSQILPGKYRLEVSYNQEKILTQDFTWGVLALNPNKSVYSPEETAKLSMAVLDEEGKMVCDAKLELRITNQELGINEILSTENGKIKVNPECQEHGYTEKPDYAALYQTQGIGAYQLELLAETQNGKYVINDSFKVSEKIDFDIERDGPTRIYPPEDYPFYFNLTFNQDFEGIIEEKVPADFEILPLEDKDNNSLDSLVNYHRSYDNLRKDEQSQIISWVLSAKQGESFSLGYRFDAPDISPQFYLLGPLVFKDLKSKNGETEINFFQESRQWQLAADAVVSSNIIVMWPGSTTLPDGWQRKTELDGYFIESGIGVGSSLPELNVALGSTDHSHTSPSHSHTIGHTHTVPASAGSANTSSSVANGTGASSDAHTHASASSNTSSVANNVATGVKNALGSVGVWNTAPSDPPYTSVIFIKSNGTNKIPNGAWAFYYSAAPTGWDRVNTDKYVKGAAPGGVGGGTGGSVTHSHTDSGHTHTEAAHSHTADSGAAGAGQKGSGASGVALAPPVHTHALTADLQTATEVGGVGLGATNNGEPLFIKVNTIQNNTPGGLEDLPDNVIAIWTGTTASILPPWYLCDGTNGTPNLNIGRFIKGADTDVGIGTTGGASTHTHASGNTHTHTTNNHTHSWTFGGNSGTQILSTGSKTNGAPQGHSHAAVTNVTSGGGNSGPADTTADANTDNRPLYKNVYLIQYHAPKITIQGATNVTVGSVSMAINGNLYGSTASISGGNWSFTNVVTPDANNIITTWINGSVANESTAITKYSGSGSITGMVLNKHVFSVGSSLNNTINVSDLGSYDHDNNGMIMHTYNSKTLNVDGGNGGSGEYTDEKIDVLASNTLSVATDDTINTFHLQIDGILTSNSNSTYNVAGNWTNNGVFTQANSTVTLNGSSAQTINGTTETAFYNLTVSNTGAAIAVSTNMSIASSGTLNMNGANTTLNPGDGVVISGLGTLTGSGTVKVTRTSATADFSTQYSISNKTLTNLTVDYAGTGQVLSDLTYGKLTISSNAISTGANSATVGLGGSGTFTVGASGVFTPSSGTMTFNTGASIVNSNSLTFQDITIAASATVTTTASFNIAGTLTVNSSANFSPGNGSVITMTGTSWAISNSNILIFKGLKISETPSSSGQPTASFSVSGTLTVDSGKTLAPTDGTITMSDVTSSIINNGGATTNLVFNNLTVTGSPSTSSDFTVNKTLNVSGGNLTPSGGTITMTTTSWAITNSGTLVFKGLKISETPSSSGQPTSSFSIAGTLTVNGGKNFSPDTGSTITMTGTAWGISNSGTLVFKGLTIDGTPSPQPTNDFSVSGALTINSGKTLAPTDGTITFTGGSIVNSGGSTSNLVFNNLTITGSLSTSSDFTVNKTLNVSGGNLTPSGGIITMATTSWAITNSNILIFKGLTIAETPSSSGQPTADFSVNGALTVNNGKTLAPTSGTITMTGTSSSIVSPGNLTFNNLSVGSGASASTSDSFGIVANFANNGAFNASNGTITFSGGDGSTQQISGNSTFYNFFASTVGIGSTGRTLQFAGGSSINVGGTWAVTGDSGKVITLKSSNETNWTINPTVANVTYVDVYRSTRTGVSFCATHSSKDVNTLYWTVSDGDSCNQAPNSPSSLAQKKIDNTVLSVGDWTNETSIQFTALASDSDTSDTLSLCVEKDDLDTAFADTEDSCGIGVGYTGGLVELSVTIENIPSGTAYHWHAMVKDAALAYSSWVAYGDNPTGDGSTDGSPANRDFGVDTTAPTDGAVFDGTNTGVDIDFNGGSLSELSANWADINANVSGLDHYEYSIGTTIGGTEVGSWISIGTGTSAIATGLTLQTSDPYYFNVRAIDNATNIQSAISSDGQFVSPSLTFSVSPSSLAFTNLNVGNSYSDNKVTTLTTSTNAYGGYVIRAFVTDYLRSLGGSFYIPDFNGGTYASPGTWEVGNTGFGYTSSDTTIQEFGDKFGGGNLYAPFSQDGPGDIVADHTDNITGDPINEQFFITNKVKAGLTQASSYYSTIVVYTATAQY